MWGKEVTFQLGLERWIEVYQSENPGSDIPEEGHILIEINEMANLTYLPIKF